MLIDYGRCSFGLFAGGGREGGGGKKYHLYCDVPNGKLYSTPVMLDKKIEIFSHYRHIDFFEQSHYYYI